MERLQELIQDTETIQKINGLQQTVAKEIFTYPNITVKDKIKRRIRKYILRQQVPKVDRFFWPNGLLAQGLWAQWKGAGDSSSVQVLEQYFTKWLKRDMPVYNPDNVVNGLPMLDLYEMTGREKYLTGVRRLAAYLLKYPLDNKGNIPYRLKDGTHVYADTIGMVCPFLCRYGATMDSEPAVKLGVAQIVHFLDYGMDARSGLPYHGFDSDTGVKLGVVGWGRAVGWLMMGIAFSLYCLPEETSQYPFMMDHFEKLSETVLSYQRQDGSFAWLLPAKEGPADTSATAMIACSLLRGMIAGILPEEEYEEAVYRAGVFLLGSIKDARVGSSSAECEGFGQYPQRFGAYPWSDGPTLRLFGLMEEAES